MVGTRRNLRQVYRLWISRYEAWAPNRWDDVPPEAVALEPAIDGVYSAAQAAAFVEGFNTEMLRDPQRRWAVAIPDRIHYEGDLVVGQRFSNRQLTDRAGGNAA